MSYEYDPNNYRIRRTSVLQKSVTEYAYDNNGSVTYQKEIVGNDVTTKSYAYFDGKIIGFYINDERYYTVTDMLGTVVDVYAEDGTEVWSMDYTSFGIKGGETVEKIQLDAMFTGKDMDSETGLTYHWNRWRGEEGYNWISEDSARDGTNWYGYAGQNPLIFIDPDGRTEISPFVRAEANGNNVIYYREDGTGVERSGGSRAWRNNNPGNIRSATYQIGSAGRFAIFDSYETGFNAIIDLLTSDNYINLTIIDAVSRYAPPNENDTENYQNMIANFTGLDTSRILNELTQEELESVAQAIQRIEGYIVGTETNFTERDNNEN